MPKVASDKTLSTETESQYPTEFPATAVEDLRRFAKSGAWLTNRTVVARDIWLLEGWANAVLIDDEPLGTSVNAQTLFEVREAIHAGVLAMKGQAGRPLLGGDAIPDPNIATAARILESDFTGLLVKVAFLRKLVSERPSC